MKNKLKVEMPPKPSAAAANDGPDIAVEIDQLYRAYRKNCNALEITINPRVKYLYDVEWNDEGKPITQVREPQLLLQVRLQV